MAVSAVGLSTHIWNNNLKSVLLLLGYPLLLLLMVFAFFFFTGALSNNGYGQINSAEALNFGFASTLQAAPIVCVVTFVWFGIAWMFHQSMINRATGARPLSRRENPRVYNLLENLCISRGIPMPKLFIIDSPVMNAYASGISEKSYAVTVTTGICDALDDEELEGVLAHELTHIMNRDVRLLIIGVIFAGMISFFAEMAVRSLMFGGMRHNNNRNSSPHIMLVAMVVLAVGWLFALVIRMAISRKREFLADAGAVELTKNPNAMARALLKISGNSKMKDVPAEVQQMFIENPPGFTGLFSTHPPIEKRVEALIRFAGAEADKLEPRHHFETPEPQSPPPSRNPWQRKNRGPWG